MGNGCLSILEGEIKYSGRNSDGCSTLLEKTQIGKIYSLVLYVMDRKRWSLQIWTRLDKSVAGHSLEERGGLSVFCADVAACPVCRARFRKPLREDRTIAQCPPVGLGQTSRKVNSEFRSSLGRPRVPKVFRCQLSNAVLSSQSFIEFACNQFRVQVIISQMTQVHWQLLIG